MWIIATNPVVSFPNYDVLQQALTSLEFLVVQDGFHPTPTTDFADLVLPAAIWGEKEGTYTNSERRIGKVNAIVAPPGEARTDFDIFLDIAERLGVRNDLLSRLENSHDAFLEWQQVSKGRICDYSQFTWQQIEDEGGAQWGGERLYQRRHFPQPGRKSAPALRAVRSIHRATKRRVPHHPEYRPNGRALAYAHQDRPG
jgi:predicted molibdopterin-dependent oxidoreductase YjgC